MSLRNWKEENQESLMEEYLEQKYELEQMGEEVPTFDKWAKEKYQNEVE